MRTLTLEHAPERRNAQRPAVIDFHESLALHNERDVLVLWAYKSSGLGYGYRVLVGRGVKQWEAFGFANATEAYEAGLKVLRTVPTYTDAAIVG